MVRTRIVKEFTCDLCGTAVYGKKLPEEWMHGGRIILCDRCSTAVQTVLADDDEDSKPRALPRSHSMAGDQED